MDYNQEAKPEGPSETAEDAPQGVERLAATIRKIEAAGCTSCKAKDAEIERLREERDRAIEVAEEEMLEKGRLRQIIEDAPHDGQCYSFWEPPEPCNCWKSKVSVGNSD